MSEAQEQTHEAMSMGSGGDAGGAGKKTLGLERWVQLGFVVLAVGLGWFYQNLISAIWYRFADPQELVVTAASVIGGPITAFALYRHAAINKLSFEVAEELSKVTWPTRRETSNSTVVVIITSAIAAALLGFFDAIWSALTDLVYKV